MTSRLVAGIVVAGLALPGAAMGQDGVPRTASGKPDLSGTYDTATLTPLQRPQQFGTRGTLTAEEAALVESDPAALRTLFNIAPGGSDERREARNAASGTQEAEQVAPPAGGDGSGGKRSIHTTQHPVRAKALADLLERDARLDCFLICAIGVRRHQGGSGW